MIKMKLYRISESRLRKETLKDAEGRHKDKEFNECKARAEKAIHNRSG